MSLSATIVKANPREKGGYFCIPNCLLDSPEIFKLTAAELGTLYSLYRHANKRGESYPSAELIARETRQSRRTVVKCLARLVKLGLITYVRNGSPLGTNLYTLTIRAAKRTTNEKETPEVAQNLPSRCAKPASTVAHLVRTKDPHKQRTLKKDPPLTPQRNRLTGRGGDFSKIRSGVKQIMGSVSIHHGEEKEAPSLPQPTPTDSEREVRGRTDQLVNEFERLGGTFAQTGKVVEQFRAGGLEEHYLANALHEMEQTRKKEGVRSVPSLLGEKILPRFMVKQTEDHAEQQRKLEKEQSYQESWERAKRDRDDCEEKNGAVDIEAMMREFKTTGLEPAVISKNPPQLQQPIAVNG